MHSSNKRKPRAAAEKSASRLSSALVETLENRVLLSGTPNLGINLRRLGYDTGDELFADAMKEAGPWFTLSVAGNLSATPAPVDASGWPTGDAGVPIVSNNSDNGGTYALSFTGQATVAAPPADPGVQVENASYDSSTNTTTAQVVVPAGANSLYLDFTNTLRQPTDTSSTGITNIVLMRPSAVDSSVSYDPSVLFSTPILNLISNFSTIRYKDFNAIDQSVATNWSDRVLPNQPQTRSLGGAWEYDVALANLTGKGMWINIPALATDDYVTKLADLIDYGSDGVNPYTGPIGSTISPDNPNPVPDGGPVWAGLNPALPVYVEYSNEVWNQIFAAYSQTLQAAVTQVDAGGSPLNYDGDGNQFDWATRYYAQRTIQVSNLFRQVFGDSQMMTQIRPVLSWQYSNNNNTASVALLFLNNYYNNADGIQHVANPEPVNYYLYGGGGGWYGGLSNPNGTGNVAISDANFSSPTVSGYKADPTGSWSFSGTAGIAANSSSLGNPASTSGTQAAYIQGSGSFSEKVNFTGGLADLTFSDASTGSEALSVSIDGVALTSLVKPTSAYAVQRTSVFNSGVSAGLHTVTFTGASGTGAVFISNVVAETVNGMYSSTIQNITNTSQSESAWAAAFGLHFDSYEGGFNFATQSPGTPLQIAANQDPRAQAADMAQMNEFYAAGGDLAMYFDTTNTTWALTLDINNQNTPKIKAVQAVVNAPQPALNFGAVLPTSQGQSITVNNVAGVGSGAAGLYVLNATAAGTYSVSLTGTQTGAEIEQFYLDGQPLPGLTSLPTGASGNSAPALTFTIANPGLHALLLMVTGSGTTTPANPAGSIVVTAGAGPAIPDVPSPAANVLASANGLTEIDVSWDPASGAAGYQIQRSANGGNPLIIATTAGTTYADLAAAPGATYTYTVVPFNTGGLGPGATSNSVLTASTNVPSPWSDADVGQPYIGGYANFAPNTNTWTVAGGGSDIWYDFDEFNFLSQSVTGNATVIARVASFANKASNTKAGVMFRASSDPRAMFVDLFVQANGGVQMQDRPVASFTPTSVASTATSVVAPEWIKLTRTGNNFTGSYSTDGTTWTTLGTVSNLALPTTSLAGLAVTARNDQFLSTVSFTNVSVNPTQFPDGGAQLALTQPPTNTVAGVAINPAVSVSVEDAFGNVVGVDASYVTLTLHGGTFASGGATTTVQAMNGVASFDSLIINTTGNNYTLTASDSFLTPVTSAAFAILPGTASVAKSIVSVSTSSVAATKTATVTLQAKDALGNNLTTGGLNVAFSLTGSGTAAGTFGSVIDHNNGTYTATFTATTVGSAHQIAPTIGGIQVSTTQPTITVTPPLTATAVKFSAYVGRTVAATVATFTDVNTSASTTIFSASITWGDGSSSTGTIVSDGGGKFHVTASHLYAAISNGFPVVVTIKQTGGYSAAANSTAVVTEPPLVSLTSYSLTARHGVAFKSLTLGEFRDDNALQKNPAAYAGTINWGDGTTATAAFLYVSSTTNVGSIFKILGSHTYAKAGTFKISITLHETASPSTALTVTATIKVS